MKSISVTCTKCNHREEVTVNDETIWTEEVKNKHVCFLCGHTKKGGTSSIIGKRKIVKENRGMFGRTCPAINVDKLSAVSFNPNHYAVDNMGLGYVIYCP